MSTPLRRGVATALAGLLTWFTMLSWAGFTATPARIIGPLAVTCLLVAAVGAGLRSMRAPALAVLLAQVAAVGIWVNHVVAPTGAVGGWIPTVSSPGAFADALAASVEAARAYLAPVPASAVAFPALLVTIGSACAILIDLVAVSLRKVAVAGLALLAIYTAPVSMLPGGVAWWCFALAALAFVGLLAVVESERMQHWGRGLDEETGPGARNTGPWPAAARIGLPATALATLAPFAVPTFSTDILPGVGGGAGDGESVRISNPALNLKRDLSRGQDVPLLRARSDDPSPGYLRMAVLDVFEDSVWKPGKRELPASQRASGILPPPEGLDEEVPTELHDWTITAAERFRSGWLPGPFPASAVRADGDWRYDASTMDFVSFDERRSASGMTWNATAMDVTVTAEGLLKAPPAGATLDSRYTEDEGLPDWLGDLARRVSERGKNKAERAYLLQQWFTESHDDPADPDFTYDLEQSADGSSLEALDEFLNVTRTGYCEQFAGAMALMARSLDIPARVAIGFLAPERVGDELVYSSHDLHAWPELFFEGTGWVRFEPTPGTRIGAAPPAYTAGLRPEAVQVPSPSAQPTRAPATASPTAGPRDLPDEPDVATADKGGFAWQWLGLLLIPVLVAVGVAPRLLRARVRSNRWESAGSPHELAEAAWAELRDSLLDLRLPWPDGITPRQRALRIGPLFKRRRGADEVERAPIITGSPDAEAALERLVLAIEHARYARAPRDGASLRADVETCVASIRTGKDKKALRRADWLPVSLLKGRALPRTGEGSALELRERV